MVGGFQIREHKIEIDKKLIDKIAKNLIEKLSEELYYQLLLLRYIPEIEAVKRGKLKTMTPKEFKKALSN